MSCTVSGKMIKKAELGRIIFNYVCKHCRIDVFAADCPCIARHHVPGTYIGRYIICQAARMGVCAKSGFLPDTEYLLPGCLLFIFQRPFGCGGVVYVGRIQAI